MPNVILIVNDSLRADHVACYNLPAPWPRPGHEDQAFIETPNLDRLGREGTIFDRAYLTSYPTVPARHDMQTGRIGFPTQGWQPLKPADVTLADRLGVAGINTQFIFDTTPLGQDDSNFMRGFEGWEWVRGQHADHYVNEPMDIRLPAARYKIKAPRAITPYLRNRAHWRNDRDWMAPHTVDVATQWLERNASRTEGFFLWVDMWDPHEPFDAPTYDLERYLDPAYTGDEPIYPRYGRVDYLSPEELNDVRARYAANVQLADRAVGRLLDTLQYVGLADDTLVVFTSDHGHLFGDHGLQGKPTGPLGLLYEATTKVPLIIRRPDGIGAGKRIDAIVHHPDIAATVLDFFGVRDDCVDGASLLPLVDGTITSLHDTVFSGRYSAMVNSVSKRLADGAAQASTMDGFAGIEAATEPITVTTREWSLIVRPVGMGEVELFDLETDPRQLDNVAGAHDDVVAELLQRLRKFLVAHDAAAEYVAAFDHTGGSGPGEPMVARERQLWGFAAAGLQLTFLSEQEAVATAEGATVTTTNIGALLDSGAPALVCIGDQYYAPADLLLVTRQQSP